MSGVSLTDEQFQSISRAIADPRRFAILKQVAAQPVLTCAALNQHACISPATVSHHIKELTEAGLLESERAGRVMKLSVRREIWQSYLQRLASL